MSIFTYLLTPRHQRCNENVATNDFGNLAEPFFTIRQTRLGTPAGYTDKKKILHTLEISKIYSDLIQLITAIHHAHFRIRLLFCISDLSFLKPMC